jgi:Down syndrome cell adhesion protein
MLTEDGAIARLAIASVERKDSATFTCVASNAFGQAELAQRVLVEESPDAPTNIQLIDRSHTSVSIRFAVPYNGNSAIRAYVAEWTTVESPNQLVNWTDAKSARFDGGVQQVSIAPLTPLTSYQVRLFAENSFGRSEASAPLTITTDEQGKQRCPCFHFYVCVP